MLPPRPTQLLTLRLGLIVSFIAGLIGPTYSCLAQNEPWIPPRSTELDRLARSVEDALAADEIAELQPALVKLAERMMDGDPGGTVSLGDGYHTGAGPYLQLVLESLPAELARQIRGELRLALRSRFVTVPPAGIQPRLDRLRTRQMLDLGPDLLGSEWILPLAQAALERGDLAQYDLIRLRWGLTLESWEQKKPEPFADNLLA